MKIKMKNIFALLMLILIIFSISTQLTTKNRIETTQADLKYGTFNLKQAGFWNNITFIHITGSNWTLTNQSDWCSGSGTFGDPYLIENMIINASGSPTGCGIFIENSNSIYFKIRNVTIFESTYGIKLENTNKGTIVNNTLLDNTDSGISIINSGNNTISRNKLINNEVNGIHLSSNSNKNTIIGNRARNDGTNLQDTGIYLESSCDDNDIMGNIAFDNNENGIFLFGLCEGNMIYNNTLRNKDTFQQDYGIRLESDCDHNIITLNIIEDLNNGIRLVTSDNNSISNNQIRNSGIGIYMLLTLQCKVISNRISGGSTAILMSAGDQGKFKYNFITDTGIYAILIILNSNDNEFHDNIIKDNYNYGIYIEDPSDTNNIFYKNSFLSNRVHAIDNGTNLWDDTVIGNYWDNYSGVDLNNDNIGDTPYNIAGSANASDNLPIADHGPPIIIINNPISSSYGAEAPEFNIYVNETYLYSMWYTINSGGIKYYFTENGTIDQDAWNTLNDGSVEFNFYARDIAWNTEFEGVIVTKDTIIPKISIISPSGGADFGSIAPEYVVEISDTGSPIDAMWYTINNSGLKYYFTENGTINQDAWSALKNGNLNITFFARDSAWNVGSTSVELIKSTSHVPNDGSLPFQVIIIIVVSIIVISLILITTVVMRKRGATVKLKKSRKLDEEQISKADYFKDITSILTILAIHKDSGLCLSKLALHGGIGLDENLFTGFISAMGSFKDELAKQMGLRVRDEGGDNTIEYNEFTITLMDGKYLRLGLVSYSSLGDLIKKQCGQVLRAYELKHGNELQNFDGEIQIFEDFEEAIESGLELNLNKKCTINVKQLHKFDAPEPFIKILNDFNSRSEGFYPAEITLALMQELNISDQEANFMLYKAYKNQIFLPK